MQAGLGLPEHDVEDLAQATELFARRGLQRCRHGLRIHGEIATCHRGQPVADAGQIAPQRLVACERALGAPAWR
ncbi:MAG: hypothetical protein ACSLFR_00815 [Solirubrobacteraceae bacterium]